MGSVKEVVCMNRREFLKVIGMGSITVFLSGCGLSALAGDETKKNVVPEKAVCREERI